ncbi:phosphoribosylanthranilate isomerase [Microaerobacter geothermalis]|uniref:phosphoribosylanthranilate isomerase n=1 Tax=Microaerobacter geothermalis TaxID=674972 RepID=UPI001F23DE3E|nr:phosphoribosylanthranilate isomerase [Microaerobacter geothermalis]MCF6093377.1 phosphoribosylanthranilate isomerase [Microaerobacter geothermalis]
MGTIVKICGLTTIEDCLAIQDSGVDYVGFVFAPSRRQVSAELAKTLSGYIKKDVKKTGVFVNPSYTEVARAVYESGLDAVQLHGDESPALLRKIKRELPVQIIKAIRVKNKGDFPSDTLEELGEWFNILLLDTYSQSSYGGTGHRFSWDMIPTFSLWAKERNKSLFVAGGLNGENVTDLIYEYQPDGVDVSSGVETDGRKDQQKIRRFVERVKGIDFKAR